MSHKGIGLSKTLDKPLPIFLYALHVILQGRIITMVCNITRQQTDKKMDKRLDQGSNIFQINFWVRLVFIRLGDRMVNEMRD